MLGIFEVWANLLLLFLSVVGNRQNISDFSQFTIKWKILTLISTSLIRKYLNTFANYINSRSCCLLKLNKEHFIWHCVYFIFCGKGFLPSFVVLMHKIIQTNRTMEGSIGNCILWWLKLSQLHFKENTTRANEINIFEGFTNNLFIVHVTSGWVRLLWIYCCRSGWVLKC